MEETWDCIVIGGGAAGLSAALTLGRARRRTLVIDGGRQSNLPAHGIGGVLGHDGRPPAELYALGRRELAAYPSVAVRDGEATALAGAAGAFEVTVAGNAAEPGGGGADGGGAPGGGDGGGAPGGGAPGGGASVERARTVLLAGGSDYEPPDLPGVAERWGGTVFHCPFCHGWEVNGRPLAVLSGDAERALLLTAWSDDVTLLTDGPAELDPEATARLAAAGVGVDERPVAGVRGPGAEIEAVVFADGSERPCGGLMVGAPLRGRVTLADGVGVELADPNPMATAALAADPMGRTSVSGVFAAGDVTGTMPSVANAVAAGQRAAAMIVHDLTA